MKQVIQNLRDGALTVDDVPAPRADAQSLLVANHYSLISAGTERATLDLARKGLLGKAQARPDLVRKVLDSVRRDGVFDTMKTVAERLDRRAALGYSCAGTVVAKGTGVTGFEVGDRVACAGQDHASHAELVVVPQNLCVRVPAGVVLADAAYVALGAIALQAVRQTEPRLGETVVVIGLGLVGLLIAQLLKANGCRVIGSDLDETRSQLAATLGVDRTAPPATLEREVAAFTDGYGADAVVIAASSRTSSAVASAGVVCRHKGRVVVVGAVGMDVPREAFYRKELELRLSTSYGPGRYDPRYEDKSLDYPYGYVRWTEQRNMAAFLDLVDARRVDVAAMTSHRFDIADAARAFDMIASNERQLGVLLVYHPDAAPQGTRVRLEDPRPVERVELGLIGAGNHVRDALMPHLRTRRDVNVRAVCCATPISAKFVGERSGADYCTTDAREILADSRVNAVLIGARHDAHARYVLDALAAGKHAFVEKPLCLTHAELDAIAAVHERANAARAVALMVGFNRRHSPHIGVLRECFAARRAPLTLVYRVNAGALPADHWLLDPAVGGGRALGEACHFVDALAHIVGCAPTRVQATRTRRTGHDHDFVATFDFADGSVGTLIYAVDGDRAVAKERIEVFGDGRSAIVDDFRVTECFVDGRRRAYKSRGRDKGFRAEMDAFVESVSNPALAEAAFLAAIASTRATLALADSLTLREPIEIA